MKVRVEIEMPVGCKDCPFYYSGELYEWCRYNEYLNGSAMKVSWTNREKRPDTCPLNDCVRVADVTVKNNPPTVICVSDRSDSRKEESGTGYTG